MSEQSFDGGRLLAVARTAEWPNDAGERRAASAVPDTIYRILDAFGDRHATEEAIRIEQPSDPGFVEALRKKAKRDSRERRPECAGAVRGGQEVTTGGTGAVAYWLQGWARAERFSRRSVFTDVRRPGGG